MADELQPRMPDELVKAAQAAPLLLNLIYDPNLRTLHPVARISIAPWAQWESRHDAMRGEWVYTVPIREVAAINISHASRVYADNAQSRHGFAGGGRTHVTFELNGVLAWSAVNAAGGVHALYKEGTGFTRCIYSLLQTQWMEERYLRKHQVPTPAKALPDPDVIDITEMTEPGPP